MVKANNLISLFKVFCLAFFVTTNAYSKTRNLKIEVKDVRTSKSPISKFIFGNFVEAGFGRQVSGMWSEMIYNRGFMLPGTYPSFGDIKSTTQWWMFPKAMYNSNAPFWHSGYEEEQWFVTDSANIHLTRSRGTESFKGLSSLLLTKASEALGGLRQNGIYLESNKEYHFSITGGFRQNGFKVGESLSGFGAICQEEKTTRPFEVILREESNPDRILYRKVFQFRGYQQQFSCDISKLNFTGRAIIELSCAWKGIIALSCCSLMPKDNIYGWRKDVVELLKAMKVPVIRYPGGCYASFYDWRKYVGPRDTRENTSSFYWGGLDDNDASIDEFMQLCDEVGCEPQICINMMSSTPFKAAEFVEYLNGTDSTSMGHFRKENGVARKRKVRFFEMDNEAGRKWNALDYARNVVDFSKAMKAVDPNIKTMMMFYSFDHGDEYLEQMLQIAGKSIDYVINRNSSPKFVTRIISILEKFNETNGTNIKLTNTEWLADGNSPEPFEDKEIPQSFHWTSRLEESYKKVLSYRQIHWFYALNGASRLLDYLSYGGDFFLANFNNCVNTWGQNVIESSKEGAWLSPVGEIFRFFSVQNEKYPLETIINDKQKDIQSIKSIPLNDPNAEFQLIENRQSQTEFLKIQTCETDDGLSIYFVNKSKDTVTLQYILPKGYTIESIEELYAPDRLSRTFLDKSDIIAKSRTLKDTNRTDIQPLSLNRLKATKKEENISGTKLNGKGNNFPDSYSDLNH